MKYERSQGIPKIGICPIFVAGFVECSGRSVVGCWIALVLFFRKSLGVIDFLTLRVAGLFGDAGFRRHNTDDEFACGSAALGERWCFQL